MEASDDGGSNGSLSVCLSFSGDIEVCVVIGVIYFGGSESMYSFF